MKICERPECSNILKSGQHRFCCRSCSAIVTNSKFPKRKISRDKCLRDSCIELANYHSIYCSNECRSLHRIEIWIRTGYLGANHIRGFLLKEQHNKCDICGINNEWMRKPLLFILDHIDGDSSNNNRDNLRLVCSNCDSQLPTYKARNKGKGRFSRRDRYAQGKSY